MVPLDRSLVSHRRVGSFLGLSVAAVLPVVWVEACSAPSDGPGFRNGSGGGANQVGGGSGLATGGLGQLSNAGGGGASTAQRVNDAGPAKTTCSGSCTDFPAEPILNGSPPANAAELFGDPNTMGASGPCVIEPPLATGNEPGALFPANWLRPRFVWTPLDDEDLWELRLQASKQVHDLVVYTSMPIWAMPLDMWVGLAGSALDEAVTVTVRGINTAAPGTPSGTRGTFTIAPVNAGGTMVYWATNSSNVRPDTSKLAGFRVGDEGVVDALTIPQVQQSTILRQDGRVLRGAYETDSALLYGVDVGRVRCIGCHVSTPDGSAVAFTDHWPWNDVLANVDEEQGEIGAVPAYQSLAAQILLSQPWLGVMTFSPLHWSTGDRIAVTSYNDHTIGFAMDDVNEISTDRDLLAWFDLETQAPITFVEDNAVALNEAANAALGTAWGFITMSGEARSAVTPEWSHDSDIIAYTSTEAPQDGRIGVNPSTGTAECDIYTVPYNNRAGGTVTAVAGASQPGVAEYYPSWSADDEYIAYTRVPNIEGSMYYRPDGEVWVVPAEGGEAIRLAANDPPACMGQTSPGIINSWPKWSPTPVTTGGRTFYFLIFSSARGFVGADGCILETNEYSPPDTRCSQLYMTAIVRDQATGQLTTFGAVYLWNQETTMTNLTPAWEDFNIPEVIIL
jgi:hypothetical protein